MGNRRPRPSGDTLNIKEKQQALREGLAHQQYDDSPGIDCFIDPWEGQGEENQEYYRRKFADPILAFLSEQGLVLKVEARPPLTETGKLLAEHGFLREDTDGERHWTIPVCIPEPTPENPRTQLHIDGEYLANRLSGETKAQDGMIAAGFTDTAPLQEAKG